MTRSVQDVALSIKRVQIRHHRALDAAMNPVGLSLAQWDALRHLHQHPDASLHELAQLIFQSDQAFGALSTRMAQQGLVQRVSGPGRAVRLMMTDKGRDALRAGAQKADDVLVKSFSGLSPRQLDQLGATLERILDAGIEQAHPRASGHPTQG